MISVRSLPSSPASRALLVIVALAAALTTLLVAPSASAIPAFARRYETSCQTCHLVFPKLTPFGEAFRRNGYRFPDGGDVDSQKDEPIALGAAAQKDVWPGVVYPGELPKYVPLSIMIEGSLGIGPHIEGGHSMEPMAGMPEMAATDSHSQLKMATLGGRARLLAGGTFGSVASFFTAITIGYDSPAEVERANVQFTPFDQSSFMVKVGKFEPALHGISIHRNVFGHQLRLNTTMVGFSGFMPEHALTGIELSGVAVGRLGWAAGVVENTVPVEEYVKDTYARLETKIGGMRLDGVGSKAGSAAWRENSLLFGVSAYRGKASISESISMPGMTMTHDDAFVRAGADVHVVVRDLLFDAVVVRQQHDAPKLAGTRGSINMAFAEVTYVTWPWLFPSVRLEASQGKYGNEKEDPRWIGQLAVNTLIRANLVLRAETAAGVDPNDQPGFRYGAITFAAAF